MQAQELGDQSIWDVHVKMLSRDPGPHATAGGDFLRELRLCRASTGVQGPWRMRPGKGPLWSTGMGEKRAAGERGCAGLSATPSAPVRLGERGRERREDRGLGKGTGRCVDFWFTLLTSKSILIGNKFSFLPVESVSVVMVPGKWSPYLYLCPWAFSSHLLPLSCCGG